MAALRCLAALCAVLLAAFALNGVAAPFVVRLGAERVVLDTPVGFSDSLGLSSPRLQELAESQTSASNKLLLFAISDADLRRFMNGDTPEFRRYMIAVIPARIEHERLSAAQFAALVSDSQRDLGPPPAATDYVKHLDAQAPGGAHLLAELRNDPTVMSVLHGTRLPAPEGQRDARPKYLLSTTTLLRLRAKALTLSVFSGFDSPADLDWIRSVTLRWAQDLQRLNRNP